jgi:hypothetical protein
MTNKFKDYINQTANEIIALSQLLNEEIETWSDVKARVLDSTSDNISVGFVSKPNTLSGIEFVIDVQVLSVEQIVRLRIWVIETTQDNNGNDRFNNIQLSYKLDYSKASQLVNQANTLSRDDFLSLAHESTDQLDNLVVGDLTGQDKVSEEILGQRYELDSNELNAMTEDLCNELEQSMTTVLERIKKSASNL